MNKPKNSTNKDNEIIPDKCFVIMPISSQDGYDADHFQLVYEDIIKPSIIAANLSPSRADESKNTNLIQLDILRSIIESPMAVCDMSAKNPNVFYELGMRQAFDMPTVLLRDENTVPPFDISGLRYVTYNSDMKHRNVVLAVEELTKAINDTYNKRDDKSEINSLIRLMELAKPANFDQQNITDELRYEKMNQLHLEKIISYVETLSRNQKVMLDHMMKGKERLNVNNGLDLSNDEKAQSRAMLQYLSLDEMKRIFPGLSDLEKINQSELNATKKPNL